MLYTVSWSVRKFLTNHATTSSSRMLISLHYHQAQAYISSSYPLLMCKVLLSLYVLKCKEFIFQTAHRRDIMSLFRQRIRARRAQGLNRCLGMKSWQRGGKTVSLVLDSFPSLEIISIKLEAVEPTKEEFGDCSKKFQDFV